MAKKIKDPLTPIAKDKLIAMYKELRDDLNWYERLELLRARRMNPIAVETFDLGEFDKDYAGQTFRAEIYCPNAADGGVIRIVQELNGTLMDVSVTGYEGFMTAFYRGAESVKQPLPLRIVAERLSLLVDRVRWRKPVAA